MEAIGIALLFWAWVWMCNQDEKRKIEFMREVLNNQFIKKEKSNDHTTTESD